MVGLMGKQEQFIRGLVENAGWEREWAAEHFHSFAPLFEIGQEIDFVLSEAARLRRRYPKILVAPLFYQLEDGLIYQIRE
jgi:carbonic anhydrase